MVDAIEWISITAMCERFGCLPNPGGIFQQDRDHLMKMQKVMQARDLVEKDNMAKATNKAPQG